MGVQHVGNDMPIHQLSLLLSYLAFINIALSSYL